MSAELLEQRVTSLVSFKGKNKSKIHTIKTDKIKELKKCKIHRKKDKILQ